MSNINSPFSFEIIHTADGSPTLSLNGGEKMHSLDGALAETLYIYSPCIEMAFKEKTPKILSLGLGLGYNEILTFSWAHKQKISPQIVSFEVVPELKHFFSNWLSDKETTPFDSCYNSILEQISSQFSLNPTNVKRTGQQLLERKKVLLESEVIQENKTGLRFNSILYDAFSSKTHPEAWSDDFLNSFLSNYCDVHCTLSTYAATGGLNRALHQQGFHIEKKKGFGKKRESTFAQR